MIPTGLFVVLFIACIIFILLALTASNNDIVFGCAFGLCAAILVTVMLGCVAVIDGKIQVWETDKLHSSMSTKCFQVGHEQKCGVFDITTDKYRYVSDGNKLTVYAK